MTEALIVKKKVKLATLKDFTVSDENRPWRFNCYMNLYGFSWHYFYCVFMCKSHIIPLICMCDVLFVSLVVLPFFHKTQNRDEHRPFILAGLRILMIFILC